MNNNCYIAIHQGIGDLFNSIGIINYYSEKYNNTYVFVLNNTNLNILNAIFINNKKIIPIIPKFINYQDPNYPNTCMNCMTYGSDTGCLRDNSIKCKYINYKNYKGKIIKIGSFNNYIDNPNEWEKYILNNISYAHCFYTYNGLNTNIRLNYFKLFNNKNIQKNIYDNFIKKYGKEYILIHDDHNRELFINKNNFLNKNLPIINLDKISNYYVDYLCVIKNAKEIHLIDSSWSMFIYLLSYKIIKNIPIFLNKTIRDNNVYKYPKFNNWNFV
jgi:hypothetical protein